MPNYTLDISDTPGAKHPLTRLVGKDGNAWNYVCDQSFIEETEPIFRM